MVRDTAQDTIAKWFTAYSILDFYNFICRYTYNGFNSVTDKNDLDRAEFQVW